MFKNLLVSALFLGATFIMQDQAEAAAVRCDVCQIDGDFRAEAVKLGPGTHIVYSVPYNLTQQWYVGSGTGGGGGGPIPTAIRPAAAPIVKKQTPPAGATEEVSRAHTLHVIAGNTIRPTYNIPVDKLGLNPDAVQKTAYDYVKDANLRAMVESATGSIGVIEKVTSGDVLKAMTDLLQMASNYTGLRDQARLIFRVVFKDGSYVSVIVDLSQQNGKSEPGSERTAAGQLIPKEISQVSGATWTNYGGDNIAPMVSHIQSMGGSISYTGSSGGTVTRITCAGKVCTVERSAY